MRFAKTGIKAEVLDLFTPFSRCTHGVAQTRHGWTLVLHRPSVR
jgi:hypothetical protein